MRYEFGDITIANVQIELAGYADFDRDPRAKHAYELCDIHLFGMEHGTSFHCDSYHEGDNLEVQALRVCLRDLIRADLKARQHQAVCDQWDDEGPDRTDAAKWDAFEKQRDSWAE